MMSYGLTEIAHAVGGAIGTVGASQWSDAPVASIETDSRVCRDGSLFVPVVAARDGHDFIDAAFAAGASATLHAGMPATFRQDKVYIIVDDTRLALKRLAKYHRKRFHIPFLQITGSVGKTTTKDMISSVLSKKYNTLKTEGNFNNDLGVPKTLFRLTQETEFAVVETGMNHAGEIEYLGEMIEPDTAVITNVGDSHIEHFGSRAEILKAKCEIFTHLKQDGAVILNGDDPLLSSLTLPFQRIYTCGKDERCTVRVSCAAVNVDGISCRVTTEKQSYDISVSSPGIHMIYPIAMSVAAGELYHVPPEDIVQGIASYTPTGERMRTVIRDDGLLLLSDCYNANPQSMAAAIRTLSLTRRKHRIAILGDMYELGALSEQLHRDMGRLCVQQGVTSVVAIGDMAQYIAAGAQQEKTVSAPTPTIYRYRTIEEAYPVFQSYHDADTAILIKASHAMGFEAITRYLTREQPSSPANR